MLRLLAFALVAAVAWLPGQKAARSVAPTIEVARIPAGTFVMGSDVETDEVPAHRVTITHPFSIGKYEITQAQWRAVMGRNPSRFSGDSLPVERVTWDEADAFCRRLSAMTGKAYRLPTEAEWEYACRAGATGRWCFGDEERDLRRYAWFEDNGLKRTHPVGQLEPNAWGLYDMHGNVWEWCSDWYAADLYAASAATAATDPTGPRTGRDRVMRGGSYGSVATGTRSSNRFFATPDLRFFESGLRVVLATEK